VGLWAVAVVQRHPSIPCHPCPTPPASLPLALPATSPSHLSRPRTRISPEQQKPSRLAATEPVVSLGREARSQEPRAKTQKPRVKSHEPKRQRKLCRRKHLSIHVPHRRVCVSRCMHGIPGGMREWAPPSSAADVFLLSPSSPSKVQGETSQCDLSGTVQLVQYSTVVGTYRGCCWGTRYLIAVWGTGSRVSIRGIFGIQLI
jgi:hypothetical protein